MADSSKEKSSTVNHCDGDTPTLVDNPDPDSIERNHQQVCNSPYFLNWDPDSTTTDDLLEILLRPSHAAPLQPPKSSNSFEFLDCNDNLKKPNFQEIDRRHWDVYDHCFDNETYVEQLFAHNPSFFDPPEQESVSQARIDFWLPMSGELFDSTPLLNKERQQQLFKVLSGLCPSVLLPLPDDLQQDSVMPYKLRDKNDVSRACVLMEDMVERGTRPGRRTVGKLAFEGRKEDVLQFLQEKMNLFG